LTGYVQCILSALVGTSVRMQGAYAAHSAAYAVAVWLL